METLVQHSLRVVTALEDLVLQEGAALANRDFNTMVELQERTAPLVEFLVTATQQANSTDLQARLAAVHARRNEHSAALAAEMNRTRAELQEIQDTRRRMAMIAPVYGEHATAGGRCQAVG